MKIKKCPKTVKERYFALKEIRKLIMDTNVSMEELFNIYKEESLKKENSKKTLENKTMERTLIEQEIRKYNPQQIHFYDNRVIEWAEENPILSNVLMSKLSDEDIEELYINLKIGFLVFQFGIEKCEKVFNEFVERRC